MIRALFEAVLGNGAVQLVDERTGQLLVGMVAGVPVLGAVALSIANRVRTGVWWLRVIGVLAALVGAMGALFVLAIAEDEKYQHDPGMGRAIAGVLAAISIASLIVSASARAQRRPRVRTIDAAKASQISEQ